MIDLHILDFYKDCAKIFNQLYISFPRKSAVFVEDIIGTEEPDEFGLFSKRYDACFSTMLWLAQQSYLSYGDTIRQNGIDQAVLSHKGFIILSQRSDLPDSLLTREASKLPESMAQLGTGNIHFIRAALKSGSSAQLAEVMSYILHHKNR